MYPAHGGVARALQTQPSRPPFSSIGIQSTSRDAKVCSKRFKALAGSSTHCPPPEDCSRLSSHTPGITFFSQCVLRFEEPHLRHADAGNRVEVPAAPVSRKGGAG